MAKQCRRCFKMESGLVIKKASKKASNGLAVVECCNQMQLMKLKVLILMIVLLFDMSFHNWIAVGGDSPMSIQTTQ